jgi:O-antigen/teichoic acid export membrane protein
MSPKRPARMRGSTPMSRSPRIIDHDRPLVGDVALMLASKVAVLALTLVSTVVVARALGPSGRGTVAVALSLTLLMVTFGGLGLHTANPFFAARNPADLPKVVANTLWLSLGIGALLIAVGVGLKVLAPDALRGLDGWALAIALAGVPFALASQLLQAVLLAQGRSAAYNLVEVASVAAMTGGLVVGFALADMGEVGAIAVIVGSNVAAGLAFVALVLRDVRPLPLRFDRALASTMLRYGLRIYVATLAAFLVGRVNLLLVNGYLGASDAGLYSIGVALSDGLHLLPAVVALNLFPRVARGAGGERSAEVFRFTVAIYLALCVATIPVAGLAIRFLYGGAFAGATTIYLWMLPGIFAYGMLSVLAHHFAGRGFPREAMLVWFPGLALNLVLALALVPGGSASAAAAAGSAAYLLVFFLHLRMFARDEGGWGRLVPRPRETAAVAVGSVRALLSSRRAGAAPRP